MPVEPPDGEVPPLLQPAVDVGQVVLRAFQGRLDGELHGVAGAEARPDELVDGLVELAHDLLGAADDAPAHPPAGHEVGLGQPVERHEARVVGQRGGGDVLPAVEHHLVVDLVGEDHQVVPPGQRDDVARISVRYSAPVGLFGLIRQMARVLASIWLRCPRCPAASRWPRPGCRAGCPPAASAPGRVKGIARVRDEHVLPGLASAARQSSMASLAPVAVKMDWMLRMPLRWDSSRTRHPE